MVQIVTRAACLWLVCLACVVLGPSEAVAQSTDLGGWWDDRFGAPHLEALTHVLAADPEHVYVTGRVDLIPGIDAQGIARWDGKTWHALATGLEGTVHAMEIGSDGALYVGGDIRRAGDVTGTNLVKWDDSQWKAAAQYSGRVYTVAVRDDGVICAGYSRSGSSGAFGDNVNCFGPQIPPKIEGMSGVSHIVAGRGDTLYVVGAPGGWERSFLAVWDGTTWTRELSDILEDTRVGYVDGRLYALARTSDHETRVMIKESDGWSEGPALPIDPPFVIAGDPVREPFYLSGSGDRPVVFKLEDNEWSVVADSLSGWNITSLSLGSNGRLYVAGNFEHVSRPHIENFAWLDDKSWGGVTGGLGIMRPVGELTASSDGCVYAGGEFILAGSARVQGFACWDGRQWVAVRGAGGTVPRFVTSITQSDEGTIYAVGRLSGDRLGDPERIFQRTKAGWSMLPEIADDDDPQGPLSASAIAAGFDGDLYAAYRFVEWDASVKFRIGRWDGRQWQVVGSGGEKNLDRIWDMAVTPDGRLIVAGQFQHIENVEANGLASWDGAGWSSFGSGLTGGERPRVWSVAQTGGKLYVGGAFDEIDGVPALNIAYWNGAGWNAMGGGLNGGAHVLVPLQNGGILVGGDFEWAGNTRPNKVALWKNGQWMSLDGGVTGRSPYVNVRAAAEAPDGSIFIGGYFLEAGNAQSYNIARWVWSGAVGTGPSDGRAPYPNPSRHEINVPAPEDSRATILVFDLLGREHSRSDFEGIQHGTEYLNVPLASLGSGMYVVHVRTPHYTAAYPIAVVR